jgi:cytochrome c-type biogenesis protein CcmE
MTVETEAAPRPRTGIRARYVVALVVCVGAIVWLIASSLSDSLVYLRDVSYAVENRNDLGTSTFRMAGQVVPGSIEDQESGVAFSLTDGDATASVDLAGDPPDLFEECAPVVVEGRWRGDTFAGDRLLIRHGNEYSEKEYDAPVLERTGCPDPANL